MREKVRDREPRTTRRPRDRRANERARARATDGGEAEAESRERRAESGEPGRGRRVRGPSADCVAMDDAVKALHALRFARDDGAQCRNVCVLAHVDHGKTTLTDALVAHNGFISQKQAGQMRYMDFHEDEQRRGITMKSAGIALLYTPRAAREKKRDGDEGGEEIVERVLITVIDSPGHVDFCSEVSAAARLSDGCLVVVDVVEGVCVQTHAVLRQAWEERLKPCLVFNKLDRVCVELGYTPMEAYERIRSLLHEVNGLMSAFESEKFISQADTFLSAFDAHEEGRGENGGENDATTTTTTCDYLEDEEDLVNEEEAFNIASGNVAFGSAIDGWAFRPDAFADLYAEKLGCSSAALTKALCGDWYYHPKMKRIVSRKVANGKLKPLFVQCILEPIWKIYRTAESEKNGEWVEKDLATLARALKVDVGERELKNTDRRAALQSVMRAWLPMSSCLLEMVVNCVPNPVAAAARRVNRVMPQPVLRGARPKGLDEARRAVIAGKASDDAPKIIFVCKMIAVPKVHVQGALTEAGGGDVKFLAFARIYSGTVRKGDKLYVLNSQHDPSDYDASNIEEVELTELYLMMGQGMFKVDEVPAGNLLAIGGLDRAILKSATLSSSLECPPFGEMMFQASAIVKVAVEPENVTDMDALVEGLRLLNRADAFVEVSVMDTGEHVVAAAGEVHLERCVADLRERFAKVPIRVSPPIISFREGVTTTGTASSSTANGRLTFTCTAKPIHNFIVRAVDDSADALKVILLAKDTESDENKMLAKAFIEKVTAAREAATYDEQGPEGVVEDTFRSAWALGPKRVGSNVLNVGTYTVDVDDEEKEFGHANVGVALGVRKPYDMDGSPPEDVAADFDLNSVQGSVLTGFQMATDRGPLCDEPLTGVQITLNVAVNRGNEDDDRTVEDTDGDQFGPLSGQIINAVRDAIRKAVLKAGTRLVEAMYLAVITTTADALGGTYAVLGKRRSQVLSETIREGTGVFVIHAYLPVATAFGFVDQLRAQTSGASTAQLVFSHWSPIDMDPFFTPTTEEEREEYGEEGDVGPNIARQLMDSVRRRKGLKVRLVSLIQSSWTNQRIFHHVTGRREDCSSGHKATHVGQEGMRQLSVKVFVRSRQSRANGAHERNLGFLLSHSFTRVPGVPFRASTVIDGSVFSPNRSFLLVLAVFEVLSRAVASVPRFCARSLGSWTFDVSPLERLVVFVLFIFR